MDGAKVIAIFIHQALGRHRADDVRQGREPLRPLTHDLIVSILAGFGARVQKVVINDLKGMRLLLPGAPVRQVQSANSAAT